MNDIANALPFYGLLALICTGMLHLGYAKDFNVLPVGEVTQRQRYTLVLLSQANIIVIAHLALQLGPLAELAHAWMLYAKAGFFGWWICFMIASIPCSPLFTATALFCIRRDPTPLDHRIWRRGTYVTTLSGIEVRPDGEGYSVVKAVNSD